MTSCRLWCCVDCITAVLRSPLTALMLPLSALKNLASVCSSTSSWSEQGSFPFSSQILRSSFTTGEEACAMLHHASIGSSMHFCCLLAASPCRCKLPDSNWKYFNRSARARGCSRTLPPGFRFRPEQAQRCGIQSQFEGRRQMQRPRGIFCTRSHSMQVVACVRRAGSQTTKALQGGSLVQAPQPRKPRTQHAPKQHQQANSAQAMYFISAPLNVCKLVPCPVARLPRCVHTTSL